MPIRFSFHLAAAIIAAAVIWLAADCAIGEGSPALHFLDDTAKIWSSPDSEPRPFGKLLVGAPVRILSQRDGWTEISLSGWTQAGGERVIYAAPGIRVMRAVVAKSAVADMKFFEAREDSDTGLVWTRSELYGWLHGTTLHPTLADLWQRAEPLFAKRCTVCHQRRVPQHYTVNQWSSYLKIMGPRTGLPKNDQALIQIYLQYHAKDGAALGQQD